MAASTRAVPALVGMSAFALYVRYANPVVGGGNVGEFQVMAHLLGIAHPPSYPVYLLLAKAAALIPLGDEAWRVNVLTGLLAAAAVWLVGVLGQRLFPGSYGLLAAAVAAATVAVMPRLWTLAVEAEVFSLHLLLVVAFWLCLVVFQASGQPRWLLIASLLAGLGFANHRTFAFIAAGGVLTVLLSNPPVALRPRVILACVALAALGLSPFVYVVRGLVTPVAYFAPTDVHRLSRSEVWYVLQGNASNETGGGRILLDLLRDRPALNRRTLWLWQQVSLQFGPLGSRAVAFAGAGVILLLAWQPAWTLGALLGSAGAALFAMAYFKYPDGDRYLLPLETVLALGAGTLVAQLLAAVARVTARAGVVRPALGALGGGVLAAYWALSAGPVAASTNFTRGGYDFNAVFNLEGAAPHAVLCTWWSSAWGWWYAQFVEGRRPDIFVVPKGPDDCLRDVLPEQFGRRPVYLPALSDKVRASDYVFFPSRDLWLAVARRAPLTEGALLKGPDDKIYLFTGGQRRWITSIDAFTRNGFDGNKIQLTPDYVLNDIPEGPPLQE